MSPHNLPCSASARRSTTDFGLALGGGLVEQAHDIDTRGFLWVEEGQGRIGPVADVAPLIPVHRTYSFAVPENLAADLKPGMRVTVPLGRRGRPAPAYVVGLDRRPWTATLRPIAAILQDAIHLTPELVALGREIALHYACPLGQTLKAMMPDAARRGRGLRTVRIARLAPRSADSPPGERRPHPARRALLETLAASAEGLAVDVLLARAGASAAVLRSAIRAGLVEIELRREAAEEFPSSAGEVLDPPFSLNEEQQAAVREIEQRIDRGGFGVVLLFGVSGSGKTEVYVRTIRHVLPRGQQAILLVPEIVLTTQLAQRLAARFPDVAVLHSGLSEAHRSLIWQHVATGKPRVVIGTRSAVFAPCPRLGLICVDEEQETGYKNLQAPRFHVRDVAILRARALGIPVLLGSATPALETWYHSAHRPDYQRLTLRNRIRELPMPRVHVVDMRDEHFERRGTALSGVAEKLLAATLERGEQGLLLVNRRGFARGLFCPACRMRVVCPNCNVGLVVHARAGVALCHYCRQRMATPRLCSNVSCGQPLAWTGHGTEHVEEELRARFPELRLERVDSDTMRHRRQVERILEDFSARRLDVLVGTQMIAKGLDFPGVSFVGILDADPTGLSSDFRAEERLFHLVTQMAGRAGRADLPGEVVVQTHMPELPSLQAALRHDYEAFAEHELACRQRVGFPPFRRLARLVVSHPRDEEALAQARSLGTRLQDALASLALPAADVLGPNPCTLSRLKGKYRYDLLLRAGRASELRLWLGRLIESNALRVKNATLTVDVDPVTLV